MAAKTTTGPVKALVVVTFLMMITVNALANILPINGQTTGGVSDAYGNLFAPAAITFAIWGVIYLLLACHTVYQLGLFHAKTNTGNVALLNKVGLLFSMSSLVNTAWVFSWHYDLIWLSEILMLALLVLLIAIVQSVTKARLTSRELFFIRIPFSVYFGWITVATVANTTVWLVSLGWNGFTISEPIWAMVIIAVGMLIGTLTMLRNRDFAYGLVLIWAYLGIVIKHTSASGFANQYPMVFITAAVCIGIFVAAEVKLILGRKKSPLRA